MKLKDLKIEAATIGLKINAQKTNEMQLITTELGLGDQVIKNVDKFCYLGSDITIDGRAVEDITNRINKAIVTFKTLRPIWRSKELGRRPSCGFFGAM